MYLRPIYIHCCALQHVTVTANYDDPWLTSMKLGALGVQFLGSMRQTSTPNANTYDTFHHARGCLIIWHRIRSVAAAHALSNLGRVASTYEDYS